MTTQTSPGTAVVPAATLFLGGTIRTVDAANSVAEAALVIGNTIAAVGSEAHCRAEAARLSTSDVEVVDLAGRTMVPGFTDPHAHPLMYGQLLSWVDCGPEAAPDIPTMLAKLAAAAEANPGEGPIRGYGYEHRNLAEQRHPTRQELDTVSTTREVYVMNASGHGGVVNSVTLAQAGITDATPNPDGGTFFRDAAGSLTGELSDAACDILTGADGVKLGHHGPNFHLADSKDQHRAQLLHAQRNFLANGVTTIGDCQVTRREFSAYLDLVERGELVTRINAYFLSSLLDEVLELGLVDKFGDSLLSFAGIKLYADGTLGGWTAYFPEGYRDDPCRTGSLYHEPAEYRSLVARAHSAGLQTATHAQSPTAIQLVIDAVKEAVAASPRADHRHRIEHCGLPTPEQITEMAELGILPVNQPQHYYNWGPGVLDAIGSPGERFNPLGEFVAASVPVTMSSDAPVAEPRPLEAIQTSITRTTRSGVQLGGDELKIDAVQALRAHTINGARAMGRERDLGSLETGKLADFVLLAADPLDTPAGDISAIAVLQTWVDGVRVF
ncbi:amidohydrolase [Arthrobacter sp. 35W]|uniref:amidohydrolase n=1 Tax=Arthrobacter sp. 35W TaxID=1132441 RepID=UPI00042A68EB|nr:amidohydrolase [Arthrobacter sp. 35W]